MSDWKKKSLREICTKITDGTHKTPKYVDTGIMFLSATNIKKGLLDLSKYKYITFEEHTQLIKRCRPEAGDIMLSKSGSLGDAVVVPRLSHEFNIFESLALLKPRHEIVLSFYLKHYLNSFLAKHYFDSITSGIAVKHLHLVDLKRMPILLPPPLEQKAIADILQTWDTAIEKTEALIVAKEKQFEWLTATLLKEASKGHKWSSLSLQKLSKVKKGEQLNRSELDKKGNYPAWNGGITPSGYTDTWNIKANTVIISEGGNSCGFVNYIQQAFWCGGHCYALVELSSNIDQEFLYFFLKSNEKRIMRLRVGSGLPNIQKKDIDKFEIAYPRLETQKSIAHILKTSRKEIDLLNQQIEHYRTQKRGLMQKLLTGEWRVKV